ncbi:MAG: hypothetical protein ACRESP_11345, partial [Pseudomonas sp.]
NRSYLDRNAQSGQYGKPVSFKPRFFDFTGLRQIQTNVCIGPHQWCRYNARPRESGVVRHHSSYSSSVPKNDRLTPANKEKPMSLE